MFIAGLIFLAALLCLLPWLICCSDLALDADQSIDYGVRQVHEMASVIKRLLNDGEWNAFLILWTKGPLVISHLLLHCVLWSGSLMIFKHYNQRPCNLTNKSSTWWAPLFRCYQTAIRSSAILDHKIGSSCHWADLKLCEATTAQTDVSYQVMSLLALHF